MSLEALNPMTHRDTKKYRKSTHAGNMGKPISWHVSWQLEFDFCYGSITEAVKRGLNGLAALSPTSSHVGGGP
jgi:hypothetical protein